MAASPLEVPPELVRVVDAVLTEAEPAEEVPLIDVDAPTPVPVLPALAEVDRWVVKPVEFVDPVEAAAPPPQSHNSVVARHVYPSLSQGGAAASMTASQGVTLQR